jgi:Na+-translocating ferredoxin:NAD+ oxidoreductase subunit C
VPIETLPPPVKVVVPLLQHAGQAASVLVKRGERVRMGQMIGEPSGTMSAAVHASVSGTVLSVSTFPHPGGERVPGVEIENDGKDTPSAEMAPLEKPWNEATPQEIVRKISACGIVGMGGAGVPTHIKLLPAADKPIDTFIVNCAECEPMMTADRRLAVEKTDDLLTGALIIKKILGAEKAFIAADAGSADLMTALSNALADQKFKDLTLAPLKTKYPQNNEKILAFTLTKRETPSGKTPADAGCVVHNAATVYAVACAVYGGTPLYQRVVTAGGPGKGSLKNYLVRVGTPIRHVFAACGADLATAVKIVMGGPMRGAAQADLDTPVIKTTAGVFAFTKLFPGVRQFDCIGCGRCMRVCPMRLAPAYLARYVDKGKTRDTMDWGIADCIECGSCAYVCPSKINLVHFMKLGKFRAAQERNHQ